MLNFSAWVREQLVHYRNGHHIRELLEEIQHLEQLIADVIAERKTWVPNRGWVTNDS
jgi:hypothetical protein